MSRENRLVELTNKDVNTLKITMSGNDKVVTLTDKPWGISWKLNRHGFVAISEVKSGSRASKGGLMPGMVLEKVGAEKVDRVVGSISIEERDGRKDLTATRGSHQVRRRAALREAFDRKVEELNKMSGSVTLSFERDTDYKYIDGIYKKNVEQYITGKEPDCAPNERPRLKIIVVQ